MIKGKKILVVDDEPDLREILGDELSFSGCVVRQAENGMKAFAMTQEEKFDAIITDVRMPGGDGVTLMKKIKDLNHESPAVLMITGFADIQDDEAYDYGVEAFVAKPFDLAKVVGTLERLLCDRKARWSDKKSGEKSEEKVPGNKLSGAVKEIKLKITKNYSSLQQAIQESLLSIGRGGVFIADKSPTNMRGQLCHLQIQFQDGSSIEGLGEVHWVRMGVQEGLPSGYGVEFISLKPESSAMMDEWITQNKPKSFIPQKGSKS